MLKKGKKENIQMEIFRTIYSGLISNKKITVNEPLLSTNFQYKSKFYKRLPGGWVVGGVPSNAIALYCGVWTLCQLTVSSV